MADAASIAALCLASISSSTSITGSLTTSGSGSDSDSEESEDSESSESEDSSADSEEAFAPLPRELRATVIVMGLRHPSSFRPPSIAIAAAACSAVPIESTAEGLGPLAYHSLTLATSPNGAKIFATFSASKPLGAPLT